ncbi:CocE/NonD family hydrolase [Cryptosporangium aurantiacum]|uniref:CocE/NonD family hydrolase n=1 Tax=Cryptosporangium aurantiacum TaxID=134849 RepID=UPI001160F4F2|nr:CocE/NonD family hydrolase [Cryptosporangium aurantiacum]
MTRLRDALIDRVLRLPGRTGRYQVELDLRVPMPDGVTLLADRYAPDDEPAPVVLVRTPYGRRRQLALLYGAPFARRGLQVVIQSVRGTFGSGGRFEAFHHERDDGLATVAWLREQPWCDGRVATMGSSYLGYTQWAIAPYADPPLAAMCPAITGSEFTSSTYLGGGVGLRGAFEWGVMVAQQESRRGGLVRGLLGVDARRNRRVMAGLPLSGIGTASSYWQEVVAHAEPDDDFWTPTDHSAGAGSVTAPISMYTVWWDIFLLNQLRDVVALQKAGRQPRLTIGPGSHVDVRGAVAASRDAFDHLSTVLLGAPASERAPVRLWLQHGGRWLDAEQWPPPSTPTTWHFGPGGGLGTTPVAAAEPDVTYYDPADPTPTVGGPVIGRDAGPADNRAIEARPDVLCYTGNALTSDLDLVGEVSAVVRIRSEPGHGDVFVRLCDVEPSGRSMTITDGFVRLRPGAGLDVPVELRPTAYRVRAGHRLRLQVSGGAYPRFARNLGTGEPAATATRTVRARRETFGGTLTLPVY